MSLRIVRAILSASALYLLFVSSSGRAAPAASPDGLAYQLIVTVNGKRIEGVQEEVLYSKNPTDVVLAEKSRNKISVLAKDSSGLPQDITSSPDLKIIGPSEALKVVNRELIVGSLADFTPSGLELLYVVYTPRGRTGPYGFNQFVVHITESAPVVGAVHSPTGQE